MIVWLQAFRQDAVVSRMYGRGCSTFLDISEAKRKTQKGTRMRCSIEYMI